MGVGLVVWVEGGANLAVNPELVVDVQCFLCLGKVAWNEAHLLEALLLPLDGVHHVVGQPENLVDLQAELYPAADFAGHLNEPVA